MSEEETPIEEELQVEETQEEQTPVDESPQETDQDRNFRRMREQRDSERQESQQMKRQMEQMQKELEQIRQASAPKEVDEFDEVDPSDWSTIEQTKKLIKRNDKSLDAKLEERMAAWEKKRAQEERELRFKEKYSDIDKVVTHDNCKQLRALDPDLADSISLIPDQTAQTLAAYKAIKMMLPQAEKQAASKQRIEANANSPKSLSSVSGRSPLSQASTFDQGLTPALKKQLLQEMNDCARQR